MRRFLPKKTYKDKLSLGSGKDRIDLYYFGPAHTNGDTWIVFPALRVMQAGDMFAWKDAPLLDRNNGGSGLEFAATRRQGARSRQGRRHVDRRPQSAAEGRRSSRSISSS